MNGVTGNSHALLPPSDHHIEAENGSAARSFLPVVVILALFQLVNMPLLQQQLLLFHNEKRAANPTSISVDADFSLPDVPDHGHLYEQKTLSKRAAEADNSAVS